MAREELLEWAEVFGHRYGTPVRLVQEALERGEDIVLEIDVQGAHQVREKLPSAVLILLEPPSMAELERRLRERATEDDRPVRAPGHCRVGARAAVLVRPRGAERRRRAGGGPAVAIIQGFPTPTEGPTRL